ncbi:MAG: CBS domain-containing protein [Planctomycetota bacterium]|nr:CBS domain-containing protein [Planctomycetota bacterium]
MRVRHGLVVTETTSLRDVAERLIISDCDLVAVTDERGKLAGVLTESNVVRALLANPAPDMTIQSIVIRHTDSIRLDANFAAVQPMFRSCAHTAIPVINAEGLVCGLLMRSDVIRSLLNRGTVDSETASSANSASVSKPDSALSLTPPKRISLHAGEAASGADSNQPRPHFLRADEARQVLWAAEDRL